MGERIVIRGDDGDFAAWLARPAGAPRGAVVVAQEIFGVNAVMREVCDRLAASGYAALCPDLFWRIEPGVDITDQSEAEWAKAFSLYKAFDVDLGVRDLGAAAAHAHTLAAKVGCVGYCLGGLLAFLAGVRLPVDAAVAYYGVGIDGHLGEAGQGSAPVMLHVAEEDGFVSKEAQAKLRAQLLPPRFTLHSYPGRDHAFARPGGRHHHAADAALADRRTLDFFAAHLG
jgi:carboxymethylenebutenolidase